MKTFTLTDNQIWFIKCAIESKSSVIQFEGLDDKTFEQDYGITKSDLKEELDQLDSQLREVKEEETEDN